MQALAKKLKAEEIIINKIIEAFEIEDSISDEWVRSNEYIFEEVSIGEALRYLPCFMIYILKTYRTEPQSMVYIQFLFALNNYSKHKNTANVSKGIWHHLSGQQKSLVLAFLKHLLHNQPVNLDTEEISKIIKRWQSA
jgi:hypothetical protein